MYKKMIARISSMELLKSRYIMWFLSIVLLQTIVLGLIFGEPVAVGFGLAIFVPWLVIDLWVQ